MDQKGVVVTGLTYYLQAWVLEKKGPVFLTSSTPLSLIFLTVISAMMCQYVSLGSVVGGALLIGGLYSLLWGKAKEELEISGGQAEEAEVATIDEVELITVEEPEQ